MNEQVMEERLSSVGCRRGDVFRKYHKYAGEQVVHNEYCRAISAFNAGIPCPEPLGIGYSHERRMFYSDYRYHSLQRIDPILLTSGDLCDVQQVVYLLSGIKCAGKSCCGWIDYLRKIEMTVPFIPLEVRTSFICKLAALKNCRSEIFVHGDFSLENLARERCSGRLMVFDFQDACCGVRNWDWAYFLSCIPPSIASQAEIDYYLLNLVRIISAVKLGRGLRKGVEIEKRTSTFWYWWGRS